MRVAFVLAALATVLCASAPAQAAPAAQKKPAARTSAKAAAKKPAKKPAKAAPVSKKAPRKAGSEPQKADPQKRMGIAGQKVSEAKGAQSAELDGLSEVDSELFPEESGASPPPNKVVVRSDGLPQTASVRGAPEVAPGDLSWMATLEKPDFPFRWDARLVKYLDYFKNNPKGRSFAAALIKRSGRYEKLIRTAAKNQKLPEDLMWVSLVESGMNPRIVSPAGAAGLWQFMPKAGAAYGLRIDKWVDERLDPERSTEAGLRFLSDLYTRFGSWELALAAYNMGHGGLLSAIRKYNTNDFWELSQLEAGIPYETSLYVPKIVALAFVAKNRQVFGCDGVTVDAPEAYDVTVVGPGTELERVAKQTGETKERLVELNPQLLGDRFPPTEGEGQAKGYLLRVPKGKAEKVTEQAGSQSLVKHTVRWGESLEFLASQVGTTESKLRSLNGLVDWLPPRPGTTLVLPKALPKNEALSEQPVAVVPGRSPERPGMRRVFYEVVHGDAMADVARVLGVRIDDLCLVNNLDRDAKLHSKMMLQAFVQPDKDLSSVRVVDASKVRVLVVGTPEFFDHFEAKNGRMRMVVTADEGDTFGALSKRYGISVGMLERINHVSRKTVLKAGDKVVVYTRRQEDKQADIYESEPREDLGG